MSRYSVGIDLGTTNCVVAWAELSDGKPDDAPEITLLPIPQWVAPGEIESRTSLPSFVYLPRDGEIDSLRSDFCSDPAGGVVGEYAKRQAADNPGRVVVAAKSWLCHGDPTADVLPPQSPPEVPRTSAMDCTVRLLSHLVTAWNTAHPESPLADQIVTLTVPASFDPAARDATRAAAMRAGLPDGTVLLEEPSAAVYRYLAARGRDWRRDLGDGDVLLVVDVGGGTTDLTLVGVTQTDGQLELERIAVGNHLLLGGDNMDLALAHFAGGKMTLAGHDLDVWQSTSLWHACRAAKERLLAAAGDERATEVETVSVLGRGSSLIGGTVSTTIDRNETASLIVEGFFPRCASDDRPAVDPASGFQDVGLPYESDPAVTRHIAAFLADQSAAGRPSSPSHLLFNGGVLQSETLRSRLVETIGSWSPHTPATLGGPDDLHDAVAIGAAFYGLAKAAGGVRIRGGTARSYYIGIETAGPAIPGVPRPLRALCVAPRGMEEGTEREVAGSGMPGGGVAVVVGRPARFRFFASTTRDDDVGVALPRIAPELVETDPVVVTLDSEHIESGTVVPVGMRSRVTELGMFELWCHAGEERWKMEFSVRE